MKKLMPTLVSLMLMGCNSTPVVYDPPVYTGTNLEQLQRAVKLHKLGQSKESTLEINKLIDLNYVNALLYKQEHYNFHESNGRTIPKTGCYLDSDNYVDTTAIFKGLVQKGLRPYYLALNKCWMISFQVRKKEHITLRDGYEQSSNDPITRAMEAASGINYVRLINNYHSSTVQPLLFSPSYSYDELQEMMKSGRVHFNKQSLISGYDSLVDSIIAFKAKHKIEGVMTTDDIYNHDMCIGDGLPRNANKCVSNQKEIISDLKDVVNIDNVLTAYPLALYYAGLDITLPDLEMMLKKLDSLDGIYSSKFSRLKHHMKQAISDYKSL